MERDLHTTGDRTPVLATYYRAADDDTLDRFYDRLAADRNFVEDSEYDFFTYDGGRVAFLPEARFVAIIRELEVEPARGMGMPERIPDGFEQVNRRLDDISNFRVPGRSYV